MSDDQFDELVQACVGENVKLQEQLVDSILDYFDMKEAVRWALHYHLTQKQLPPQVWAAIDEDLIHLKDE